jgi:phosphate transport system protein
MVPDDSSFVIDRMLDMVEQATPPDGKASFHAQLDSIDDSFVTTGLRLAEQMPGLIEDWLSGDPSCIERSSELARETSIDCERIDEAGFVLLALQAPVGGDLRRLVALLRMTLDVDRSASLLRHACLSLETASPRHLAEPMRSQVAEMARLAGEVFAAGIDAWRRRDALAVHDVDKSDEDVDELQRVLLAAARSDEDPGKEMLVLGLLTRYFERIADHGVEVARDAAFVATGERIRVGRHRVPSPEGTG